MSILTLRIVLSDISFAISSRISTSTNRNVAISSYFQLEQIQLEIRDLEPSNRQTWTNKLNCAQAELKRLETEYKTVQDKTQNPAYDSAVDDFEDIGIRDEQKQRLLNNSERIERTGNRLTEGYRIILETEQIGTQVLQDLHHQRETIQSARSRMRETNADLGRASRTLNSMMARALREKAVLYGIGVLFVVVVSLSIYFSISSSK